MADIRVHLGGSWHSRLISGWKRHLDFAAGWVFTICPRLNHFQSEENMKGFKVLILLMCIAFMAIPGVQAEPGWQMQSIADFNVAFCRKADASGLSVYFTPSGAVWVCVILPEGTEKVDLSRPIEVRVDQSEPFLSSQDALQPEQTAVAWQIKEPGSGIINGSLLDHLMKGSLAHVSGHVSGGHRVKMTVPLNGSRDAIESLLSMRMKNQFSDVPATNVSPPANISPPPATPVVPPNASRVRRMPRAGNL